MLTCAKPVNAVPGELRVDLCPALVTSATCLMCGEAPEMVQPYFLTCPMYSLHRAIHFVPLGFSGRTMSALLTTKTSLRLLFIGNGRDLSLDTLSGIRIRIPTLSYPCIPGY